MKRWLVIFIFSIIVVLLSLYEIILSDKYQNAFAAAKNYFKTHDPYSYSSSELAECMMPFLNIDGVNYLITHVKDKKGPDRIVAAILMSLILDTYDEGSFLISSKEKDIWLKTMDEMNAVLLNKKPMPKMDADGYIMKWYERTVLGRVQWLSGSVAQPQPPPPGQRKPDKSGDSRVGRVQPGIEMQPEAPTP